jgi:hypothetical protein
MCAAQCGRQMLWSPDVRITKSDRAAGVLEEKRFTKEGAEFREHSLRRCDRSRRSPTPPRRQTVAGGAGCSLAPLGAKLAD